MMTGRNSLAGEAQNSAVQQLMASSAAEAAVRNMDVTMEAPNHDRENQQLAGVALVAAEVHIGSLDIYLSGPGPVMRQWL